MVNYFKKKMFDIFGAFIISISIFYCFNSIAGFGFFIGYHISSKYNIQERYDKLLKEYNKLKEEKIN